MKIKLHNSFAKVCPKCYYAFGNKLFLSIHKDGLSIFYRNSDRYFFLHYSLQTKEFKELEGFGIDYQHPNPDWFKLNIFNWKEMSKEDEN